MSFIGKLSEPESVETELVSMRYGGWGFSIVGFVMVLAGLLLASTNEAKYSWVAVGSYFIGAGVAYLFSEIAIRKAIEKEKKRGA